ncbi:MAG: protein kinase [Longimicrobiales bacterium]|nr:protein kinase [Longimicrobiales bacterium]
MIDRLNTALEGRYRIERELGEGGMATVFLADDLRHDRKVALKVLKPELAAVVGAERFLGEIKTTANLQHPHILPLFDSGQAASLLYFVMPYMEGDSLRDRLNREKQLPVEETLEIVEAIGSGLEYAHGQGVVHRDIKPANVMFQAGQPVVADFGIALALRAAGGSRITETGLSLGTPHYMSPEQATGDREVDRRSDVYSLGCVLYEMLTGDPPHTGATVQSVVAKLLSEDPRPVSRLRSTVPRNVEAATAKALARVPADRFQSVGAFLEALRDPDFDLPTDTETPVAGAAERRAPLGHWVPWALAAVLAVLLAAGWLRKAPAPQVSWFSLRLPDAARMTEVSELTGRILAISPDGSMLAYVGAGDQGLQLFIRERGSLQPRPLPGTVGGVAPFFSPNGDWLGFSAEGELKKVRLEGGPAVRLTGGLAGLTRGATWTADDEIIYSPTLSEGLYRIPAGGGEARRLTEVRPDLGELNHRFPDALPGGDAVILTVFTGDLRTGSVAAYHIPSGEMKTLVEGAFYGRWVPGGHLAYVRDATLLVQPFDPERLEFTGDPVAVTDHLAVEPGSGGTDLAISVTGTLVYRKVEALEAVVRVDRDGSEEVLLDSLRGLVETLRFSPDGRSIVFGFERDIWMYELGDPAPVRHTFVGTDWYPAWSLDGRAISFASTREGGRGVDLFIRPADGSGDTEVLYSSEHDQYEHAWTRSQDLVIRQTVPETGRDIWLVPFAGGADARPLVRTQFDERAIALSPDDRWVAYVSNESGPPQVYIRPLSESSGRWLISDGVGEEPAWSPDGTELYYRSGSRLIAARLELGNSVRVTDRSVLFDVEQYGANTDHTDYDVHPTDGWFIFSRDDGPPPELIWVDHWVTQLENKSR